MEWTRTGEGAEPSSICFLILHFSLFLNTRIIFFQIKDRKEEFSVFFTFFLICRNICLNKNKERKWDFLGNKTKVCVCNDRRQLIFQSLPNHFIDHNTRANTGIKRVDRAKKRKRDDMVAVVFDADASAFPFRTDNNSNWASEVGGEDIFPADFRAENPQAVLFEFFDGVFNSFLYRNSTTPPQRARIDQSTAHTQH